jgi:hypothetical protein
MPHLSHKPQRVSFPDFIDVCCPSFSSSHLHVWFLSRNLCVHLHIFWLNPYNFNPFQVYVNDWPQRFPFLDLVSVCCSCFSSQHLHAWFLSRNLCVHLHICWFNHFFFNHFRFMWMIVLVDDSNSFTHVFFRIKLNTISALWCLLWS